MKREKTFAGFAAGKAQAELDQLRARNAELEAKEKARLNSAQGQAMLREQLRQVLTHKRRKPWSLEELSGRFDIGVPKIREALEQLSDEHLNLSTTDGGAIWVPHELPRPAPTRIDVRTLAGRQHRFAVTADNHLGSRYARLDVLNALFDLWADQGITTVYQLGNIVDGESHLNRSDLIVHTMEGQIAYWLDNWPQRKGIVTKFLTGDDHEGWWVQREGVDVGKTMRDRAREAGRTDLEYLGHMEHDIVLDAEHGSAVMRLIHGGGGSAYATSYTVQKIVESYSGGEKPNILLTGHYHKAEYGYPREVHAVQVGCFPANVKVTTSRGRVPIRSVGVGDKVKTHNGAWRDVTRVMEREYDGPLRQINYGRRGRPDQTLTCTPEHPILTLGADGIRRWVEASNVRSGDMVIVEASRCRLCGAAVPFWGNLCLTCNPMDDSAVREKLAAAHGGRKSYRRGGSDGEIHLARDVIPFCKRMVDEGWRIVPVGAGVIPDAVGFRDGEVVLFEVERSRPNQSLRKFKELKYADADISTFADRVEWIELAPRRKQPRSQWVEVGDGFVAVPVLTAVTQLQEGRKRRRMKVYNLSVAGDESYVAGRVAVHNCTQDQSPFMRKKKLQAHLGGFVISFEQSKDGLIHGFTPRFDPFYDLGFYAPRSRWRYMWRGTLGAA